MFLVEYFVVYCYLFPLYQSGTFLLKFGYFKENNYQTDTETFLEKDLSYFFNRNLVSENLFLSKLFYRTYSFQFIHIQIFLISQDAINIGASFNPLLLEVNNIFQCHVLYFVVQLDTWVYILSQILSINIAPYYIALDDAVGP